MSETEKEISLREALKILEKAVVKTSLFFNELEEKTKREEININELLTAYDQIYQHSKTLEDLSSVVTAIKNHVNYELLPDTLEKLELDSVRHKGKLFSLGVRINCSIPLNMREKGYQWLKDNGLSALIQETVNAKTLSSAVKSHIEEHAIKPPEDAIKIHQQRYISLRKA